MCLVLVIASSISTRRAPHSEKATLNTMRRYTQDWTGGSTNPQGPDMKVYNVRDVIEVPSGRGLFQKIDPPPNKP